MAVGGGKKFDLDASRRGILIQTTVLDELSGQRKGTDLKIARMGFGRLKDNGCRR